VAGGRLKLNQSEISQKAKSVEENKMPRGGRSKKSGDPIDKYVGEQIRRFRVMQGSSQTALAETLGLTFQQVQKYEKGTNRIAPSRLLKIADLLGVDISRFFPSKDIMSKAGAMANDPIHVLSQTRSGMRLARSFVRIDDEVVTGAVVELVEAIAGSAIGGKDGPTTTTADRDEEPDGGTHQTVHRRTRSTRTGARAAAARPHL
jgi:transcriptional regulator with XRE-family HTH domain